MRKLEIEVKVGIFVTVGMALIMLAILVLGSAQNLMARKNSYFVHFPSVEGMIPGAKVVLSGLQVGTVKALDLDPERHNIKVELSIEHKSAEWIKEDSKAEIVTQGVLGDKYITISPGSIEKPSLPSGADIPTQPTKDFSQIFSKSDQLLISLNSIANSLDRLLKNFESGNRSETFFQGISTTSKNLSLATERLNRELDALNNKSTIYNLNGILEKINNGTGTLGALVNDPALYDDVKALVGGANRNKIMRNLVRQTIKKSEEQEAKEAKEAQKKQ